MLSFLSNNIEKIQQLRKREDFHHIFKVNEFKKFG